MKFSMIKRFTLILCILAACGIAKAGDESPRYFGDSPGALAEVKSRLAAHDESLQPALNVLVKEADHDLHIHPPSVVEKGRVPPSGDKHDYMTIAPYFWPDPAKSNGLPYIRHDGKVNPESRDSALDHGRMLEMGHLVETLALAYYFTGNQAYAEHAAACLRVWFLDPATRMNPNLNFAQAVLGENTGRGTGILEGRNIAEAADAAGLLAGSSAWPSKDDAALKAWLKTYLDWLLTSKNGLDESNARNNHGTFYDVQAMRIALVLGQVDLARQIAEAAKEKRIAVQIEPDGRQPLELERTASLGYSRFNLEAMFALATLSENVGVDLWHCQLENRQNALAAALDFLLPYVADPSKEWPYEQIKNFNRADFAPLLRQAAVAYHEPKYEKILSGLPDADKERLQLFFPTPARKFDLAAIDCERILKAANVALKLEPISITKYRSALSQGGTNDFYSNADYFWPDPTKPDGLPYVNRDGESNPNNFWQHRMAMRDLRDAVASLAAAYKATGEDRYATKAAELLRVFFLDPKLRMNPNLQFAQAVPGRSPGRSYGIIDGLHLIEIPPAIVALQKSPAFTPELVAGLKQWFQAMADWMVTSTNGQTEAAAKNNHAVAFWLQIACYAQFTSDVAKLAECRRQFREVFVQNQMAADGSFPLELKRTKPYGYSIFQLDNMVTLCQVLSTPDDNLWKFELPDGRGIRKAVAYLEPFLADKSKWPLKPDVMAWDGWPTRQSSLLFAGLAFDEQKYLELWKTLPPDPADEEVQRNIAITQPLLWLQNVSASELPQTRTARAN
jgi:hypothetical protein